jgi:hypothetical protein
VAPDELIFVISKFSLRRFQRLSRLAIHTDLAGINLKSSRMCDQYQLFAGWFLDLLREPKGVEAGTRYDPAMLELVDR